MQYITKENLRKMMLYSCERIEQDQEKINKINVFPVPDQDTGGNLARTLSGIKESIQENKFEDLDSLSKAILDGALTAAQGNSGIIYTSFLAGFLSVFKNKNPISTKKVAEAMDKGSHKARLSIQSPKEGTVLDVIDAATKSFQETSQEEKDIIKVFKKSIEKGNEALLATKDKLESLKKANVVDAGGMGFLMILESYVDALENGDKEFEEKEKPPKKKGEVERFVQVLSNRYEVVALIRKPVFSEKEIRKKLNEEGEYLDIIRIGNRMKIHIHTDFPDEVKNIMRGLGYVEELREEDMSKEIMGEESVKEVSIGLVTGEVADLLPKIVEKYSIETVPFKINWPEGRDIKGENIYQKMIKAEEQSINKLPTTSQPSTKAFLEAFKKQIEKFDKVLCITISQELSGTYNSARKALEQLPESQQEKVYIIDSRTGGAGQALLVLKAIELIQTQTEIYEVVRILKEKVEDIHTYIFPQYPRWLEKGGRLSSSQANWLRRLQKIGIRPFLTVKDGSLVKGGFRFGAREISEALFKELEEKSKKVRKEGKRIRVVITHCDNLGEAEKLKEKLKNIKAEVSFINLNTATLGVHLGPQTLVAAWSTVG